MNHIYDYYFAALRAGHAGQALDITGLGYLIEDVIERGDYALAEARILAIHTLKTAVPAASLARMGALVGGGTPEQIEAIGRYYESVGKAFQIMDDVLNLRGIYSGKADKTAGMELKTLGEDITAGACVRACEQLLVLELLCFSRRCPCTRAPNCHCYSHCFPSSASLFSRLAAAPCLCPLSAGKITMPVVKAISRLSKADMFAMWEVIKSKPADRAVVQGVIDQLEACGAVDACVRQAQELVEESYAVLQPLIPDSFSKILLRSFGEWLLWREGRRAESV